MAIVNHPLKTAVVLELLEVERTDGSNALKNECNVG